MADEDKRPLRRDEAAEYVSERYRPLSPNTLASLATRGGGPAFRKSGRWALYEIADLDAWATGQVGPLVHSTAELPKRAPAKAEASMQEAV